MGYPSCKGWGFVKGASEEEMRPPVHQASGERQGCTLLVAVAMGLELGAHAHRCVCGMCIWVRKLGCQRN